MKYMGSKSRFAKAIYAKICELSPRNGRPWFEPFAGGMNMICEVPHEDGPRYANDCNEYLIAMFKAMADGWIPPQTITREFYEKCRNFDEEPHVIGYVGFNCSYSGKWFGGYAGEVKTAIGTVRNYQEEAFRHMQKQIAKLKEVWYCNASYDEIQIPENSIIYCDPPYRDTTKYATSDFDYDKFYAWCKEMAKNNIVLISEYWMPEDGFECIWEGKLKCTLDKASRTDKTEKLYRCIPCKQ